MMKTILGAAVGVVSGFAVIYGIETLGHQLYPVATSMEVKDRAQLEAFMKAMPLGGLIFVVAAWILGAYVGSMVALLAGGRRRAAGLVPPVLIFAATIVTLFMMPHPVWMAVTGLAGIAAAAWLADRLFALKQA